MMALPDEVAPIAQAILNASDDGISKADLLNMLNTLKEKGEKPWKGMSPKEIENSLKETLQILLRRVLIESKKTLDHDIYYPKS
jgi:hypothetical protein